MQDRDFRHPTYDMGWDSGVKLEQPMFWNHRHTLGSTSSFTQEES